MSSASPAPGPGAWRSPTRPRPPAATVVLWGRDEARMRAIATTRRERPAARRRSGASGRGDIRSRGAFAGATRFWWRRRLRRAARSALRLATAPGSAPLVTCAKGDRARHARVHDRGPGEAAPGRRRAILSGPSFAADVAAGLPTAVTLASSDEELARALCEALRGPTLRLYHSTDVRGVEIGGAAKNVLAIACGVAAGRGLGASAVAALVARGFAELRRFGEAFGARGSTLMGLSGLGDLVSDLLLAAIAQLRLRPGARTRRERSRKRERAGSSRACSPRSR